MLRESEVRERVEPYQDSSGLVCMDKAHTDGNDGPHKTGFWYGALALKRWLTEADVSLFVNAIEGILSLEGRLLRHRNTRIPVQRNYWQPGSRDQYQSIFFGLALCWKTGKFWGAQAMARELYTVLRYDRVVRLIPICGRDIVSPQHWYAFGVSAGIKHKSWFRWLAGVSEIVNSMLLLTKHSESANILAYYRLMVVHELDAETAFHTFADWLLDLKFDYATEMRTYWTRNGGPPLHLAFFGEENLEAANGGH